MSNSAGSFDLVNSDSLCIAKFDAMLDGGTESVATWCDTGYGCGRNTGDESLSGRVSAHLPDGNVTRRLKLTR